MSPIRSSPRGGSLLSRTLRPALAVLLLFALPVRDVLRANLGIGLLAAAAVLVGLAVAVPLADALARPRRPVPLVAVGDKVRPRGRLTMTPATSRGAVRQVRWDEGGFRCRVVWQAGYATWVWETDLALDPLRLAA